MAHAEVIFETGDNSVVHFDSEDELKGFLKEHHRRAAAGEAAGPVGGPASRIKRVLLYDDHPATPPADNGVDAKLAKETIDAMTKDGKVDVHQVAGALRGELSAVYTVNQGVHETRYKADADEMNLDFLSEVE